MIKELKFSDLTKKLEHMTISRCTSTTGNCTKVSANSNFFCFLPDGSAPENAEEKYKHQTMLDQKKIICIPINLGFLIMVRECNET